MSIASWMENGRSVTSKSDTIFAVATARGAAGVAVIRISGEAADAALAALTRKALPDYRHAALRTLFARDGSEIDEALILRFEKGRSFTGEPVVEFQTHGSLAWAAMPRMVFCSDARTGLG